ncbi:4Fe-4S dicluster domain-containing protein [Vicingaceae bacterium]|nr:4Fe-4S dicluster domain-containing protein [Vicingaceae bacterium]
MSKNDPSRREFIGKASVGVAAAAVTVGTVEALAADDDVTKKFQPQEYWQERIKPLDDGKRYGWFIDTRRCFGCHGCEVSCKSENDVPLGNYIRQTIYQDVGDYPKVARMFLPMACQHCEDAPCIKGCPCGALKKGIGGTVVVDYETCCGHGTCVEVCPYGAIYMDPVAKQAVKCHNCYHRLEHDMEPACAATCPSDAIYFGDLNDSESKASKAMAAATQADVKLVQLRTDKKTKPRMWFAGDAPVEVEPRIPNEGNSYSPDAYNIYNWKSSDTKGENG